MASQSPSIEALTAGLTDAKSYLDGWAQIARLMASGSSWSGHERNCVFVHSGGAAYRDVSAISGLDFDDDGRTVVATDLDGDGDLDIVLKNRSGPQLRVMRNSLGRGHALQVRLVDAGTNRDAIGARVEVTAGTRRLVRIVTAGDGYLAQSSRWLHFGLAGVPPIAALTVRWPDGSSESFVAPSGAGRFVATRGTGKLVAMPAAIGIPDADRIPLGPLPASDAVVLREPLLLPPTLARVALRGKATRPVLLAFWRPGCATCAAAISGLAADHAALAAAGIDIVFFGLSEPADQATAAMTFQELLAPHPGAAGLLRQRPASPAVQAALAAVLEVTLGRDDVPATVPVGLLVDAQSQLQVIYVGGITATALAADTATFGRAQVAGPLRSHRAGRWAFAVQRPLAPMVQALARRGLLQDAGLFERLHAQRSAGPEKSK